MIPVAKIATIVAGALFAVMGLTVLLGSWYTVDQSERGVLLRNGAVVGTVQPGLGFKMPWIDSVVKIDVQTHKAVFDKMESYSFDQQVATLRISVNYRIDPARVSDVYSQYQSLDGLVGRLLSPHVPEETKVVFGGYTAVKAIQQRGALNLDIATAIRNAVVGPVVIESVQLENIDFSKAYELSVEQRMQAEVEVQKIGQNAIREKETAKITVTIATANADAVKLAADAQAHAIKVRGDAEAGAIRAKGAALGDNPHLVTLVQAERWNGVLPTTMVPGSAIPMISVGK